MAFKIGQKLKKIVGTVAPALGGALAGPLGGLAGRAIQDALGVDSEAAALKMLESDPDSLLKLKTAEMAFEQRMAELGIDLEHIAATDRASARQLSRETTLWPQIILAALYTIAYIGVLWAYLRGYVLTSPENTPMVQTLVGALTAVQVQILNFFFGSSSGSARKTNLLAKNGHG